MGRVCLTAKLEAVVADCAVSAGIGSVVGDGLKTTPLTCGREAVAPAEAALAGASDRVGSVVGLGLKTTPRMRGRGLVAAEGGTLGGSSMPPLLLRLAVVAGASVMAKWRLLIAGQSVEESVVN